VAAGRGATEADQLPAEPVIDIHQHTNYTGRSNEQLIAHQKAMGVTTTVLLPAGKFYGLDAQCGGNLTVVALAKKHPGTFFYFANEVADLPEARNEIRWFLRRGAIGIGEQKFKVASDSKYIERLAGLAADFGVPMLLHFQHGVYNTGIENFHRILERFPRVNFIGHAQTWWANVDKQHEQAVLYPKTKVTPGGITDRLLRDYPNMYGDMSAGSGLNFLTRDEDHARAFLDRHQDKLLFGSDCDDTVGSGAGCQGAQILAGIRRLAPGKAVERKILHGNARRLLRIASAHPE
jgi:predicted TIM-barrel fold metal-dependent hydrolase